MNKLYAKDFNMVESNPNGQFVSISELNQMINCGAIQVNRQKIEEYKFNTTMIYAKNTPRKEPIKEPI